MSKFGNRLLNEQSPITGFLLSCVSELYEYEQVEAKDLVALCSQKVMDDLLQEHASLAVETTLATKPRVAWIHTPTGKLRVEVSHNISEQDGLHLLQRRFHLPIQYGRVSL